MNFAICDDFALLSTGNLRKMVCIRRFHLNAHDHEVKHFAVRRLTEMAKSRGIAMNSGERAKPVRFDLEPGVPLI
jgi:aminoglycoside phosphotransferase family enzyme